MFVANGQGTKENRSRANLARSALSRLQSCLWSRRKISLPTNCRMWATTVKAALEPLSGQRVFGYAQWRKDWVNIPSEVAQDRRAWCASVRKVENSFDDIDSSGNACPLALIE